MGSGNGISVEVFRHIKFNGFVIAGEVDLHVITMCEPDLVGPVSLAVGHLGLFANGLAVFIDDKEIRAVIPAQIELAGTAENMRLVGGYPPELSVPPFLVAGFEIERDDVAVLNKVDFAVIDANPGDPRHLGLLVEAALIIPQLVAVLVVALHVGRLLVFADVIAVEVNIDIFRLSRHGRNGKHRNNQ